MRGKFMNLAVSGRIIAEAAIQNIGLRSLLGAYE